MFDLGWDVDGYRWKWHQRLLAWEEDQVRECYNLLY